MGRGEGEEGWVGQEVKGSHLRKKKETWKEKECTKMNTERGHHSKELCTDGDKQHQNWHTGLLTLHDAMDDHRSCLAAGSGSLGTGVMGHGSFLPNCQDLEADFRPNWTYPLGAF